MTAHYLGIEIGGTKLQLGVGPDDGRLRGLWRGTVEVSTGGEGIRQQIERAVPELLASSGVSRQDIRGVGIGFGGPVDDMTRTVIRSNQIQGWNGFPLADWVSEVIGLPAVLGNDEGFERIFVEQLKNLASPGDLLIAISGSGNSPNILRAVEWANAHDMMTFGCTGFSGGKLRQMARKCLHVPLDDMGIVETVHLAAFHWVVDDLHRRIGLDNVPRPAA